MTRAAQRAPRREHTPALAALAVVLAATVPARAQTADPPPPPPGTGGVAALIREGIALRERGDDEAALARFRAAYALDGDAQARAQMALAAQALGRWLEAETYLREALAAAGDPWIRRQRAALGRAERVIAQHVGGIEVRAVPGAEVRLDGRVIGTTPFPQPARAVAGPGTIEVRAPGYHPQARAVLIVAGEIARESVDLVALPPPEPEPPPRPAPRPAPPATRPVTVRRAPAPRAAPSPPNTTAIAVGASLAAGGVVVLAGGVAAHVVRELAARRFNDAACWAADGVVHGGSDCASDYATGALAEPLAIAGYAVGGALLVGGAIALGVGARPARAADAHPSRAAVSCAGGPGLVGVSCRLAF